MRPGELKSRQTRSGINRKQSPKSTTDQVARNNERVQ